MSIKTLKIHTLSCSFSNMRILHFVFLILAVFILLKNVSCDSSNRLPKAPLSSLPKSKASPNFQVLATSTWKNIRWEDRDELFLFLTHEIANKYTNGLRPMGARTLSGPHVAPPLPTNTQLDEVRRRRTPPTQAPPQPSKVKSYTLAVQWPPGVCSGKDNTCKIPKVPTEFTIHGLWPEFSRDDPPTPKTFDIQQLGVLTTELEKSWPNVWSAQQQLVYNLLFWNAEWNKHGRFSKMEGLDYFKKTLALYKDVGQGLKAKLAAEKITPVNAQFNKKTYTLVELKTALQKINGGFSCTIRCVPSKLDNVQQIHEIRFGYKQNFDKDNSANSNCSANVRFPA